MKQVIAVALLLVVGACAFGVYKLLHSRQASQRTEPVLSTEAHCDQGLWEYVYNPSRLQVLDRCVSVTGTVELVRKEADGDVHIRFRLDQQYSSLLNETNISRQHGDLVLEPICQGKVRQADAAEPCSGYDGPYFQPEVGRRYLVWGTYVHDMDHGWNEVHPITSMQPIQ